jgi:hypothetical protein
MTLLFSVRAECTSSSSSTLLCAEDVHIYYNTFLFTLVWSCDIASKQHWPSIETWVYSRLGPSSRRRSLASRNRRRHRAFVNMSAMFNRVAMECQIMILSLTCSCRCVIFIIICSFLLWKIVGEHDWRIWLENMIREHDWRTRLENMIGEHDWRTWLENMIGEHDWRTWLENMIGCLIILKYSGGQRNILP